jgi:uncharacterized protein (TIGR02453 family)
MLQQSTINFLSQLAINNSKPWFDANKKNYESSKSNFLTLTQEVIQQTSQFDASIADLLPKECIFRINRDVRFSKDKSPYKINMGMSIAKGGKKSIGAGYYFHLEPNGKSFVGGGLYMAMPNEVKNIRQEIDYCFDEFSKIIANKPFKETYSDLQKNKEFSLVRPPKGYDENNAAIDYLKLKSWVATSKISDTLLTSNQLATTIANSFKALHPLLNFINRAIENNN